MTNEFVMWVIGILEDYPLPYEVENIYFCLHKEKNFYSYVSFGGNEFENQNILINFQYYPLDAQFFDLYRIKNKNFSLIDLRIFLTKALQNKSLKTELANKKIFYGIYGCKEIYKLD